MSVEIYIPQFLQHLANGVEVVDVNGRTVGEYLNNLVKQFPQLEASLMPYLRQSSATLAPASPSLSTAMICSSVYFFAFTRALLMIIIHRKTLRATGLVFGGRVTSA